MVIDAIKDKKPKKHLKTAINITITHKIAQKLTRFITIQINLKT